MKVAPISGARPRGNCDRARVACTDSRSRVVIVLDDCGRNRGTAHARHFARCTVVDTEE